MSTVGRFLRGRWDGRFFAETRSVCSRVLSAVWLGPVRMRRQRFCVLTDTDPTPRVKFLITGFAVDPMNYHVFFGGSKRRSSVYA